MGEELPNECYICGDFAGEHGFIPQNCNCRGTIAVHAACIAPILRTKTHCSICRGKYIPPNGHYRLYWEETGNLRIEGTINNGILDGLIRQYYKSGELYLEYTQINGNREGIARSYYRDGQIMTESTFLANKMHGIEKTWNEDGSLDIETPYVHGKIEGILRYFHNNGSISAEEMWINDYPHGLCCTYFEDGSVKKVSLWVHGDELFANEVAQPAAIPS